MLEPWFILQACKAHWEEFSFLSVACPSLSPQPSALCRCQADGKHLNRWYSVFKEIVGPRTLTWLMVNRSQHDLSGGRQHGHHRSSSVSYLIFFCCRGHVVCVFALIPEWTEGMWTSSNMRDSDRVSFSVWDGGPEGPLSIGCLCVCVLWGNRGVFVQFTGDLSSGLTRVCQSVLWCWYLGCSCVWGLPEEAIACSFYSE